MPLAMVCRFATGSTTRNVDANPASHSGPPVGAAGPKAANPSENIDTGQSAAERHRYRLAEVLSRVNVLALEEQQRERVAWDVRAPTPEVHSFDAGQEKRVPAQARCPDEPIRLLPIEEE